jgi:hypothetical protein
MPPSSPDGDASPKRPFGQERRLGRNSSPTVRVARDTTGGSEKRTSGRLGCLLGRKNAGLSCSVPSESDSFLRVQQIRLCESRHRREGTSLGC